MIESIEQINSSFTKYACQPSFLESSQAGVCYCFVLIKKEEKEESGMNAFDPFIITHCRTIPVENPTIFPIPNGGTGAIHNPSVFYITNGGTGTI